MTSEQSLTLTVCVTLQGPNFKPLLANVGANIGRYPAISGYFWPISGDIRVICRSNRFVICWARSVAVSGTCRYYMSQNNRVNTIKLTLRFNRTCVAGAVLQKSFVNN